MVFLLASFFKNYFLLNNILCEIYKWDLSFIEIDRLFLKFSSLIFYSIFNIYIYIWLKYKFIHYIILLQGDTLNWIYPRKCMKASNNLHPVVWLSFKKVDKVTKEKKWTSGKSRVVKWKIYTKKKVRRLE